MSTPDPNRWRALAVLGVAFLMVVLDVAIVNVALPSIQKSLHFSTSSLEWVVSGYALTFGGFLLLGGRLGDLLGRRRVFIVGLILFSAFSLACGLAVSPTMLIATRVLQGAAGALLSPSVYSIVSVTFDEGSERNRALGILGAIAGSGAAIGVLLGGVLTEFAGWEWIFFVNVPIGVAVLLIVRRVVRESRAPDLVRHFDAAGAVTITGGLMLFVYGLTRAPTVGWGAVETIVSFAGSALLIATAVVVELRSRSPLVNLAIFRRRTLAGANLIGLILGTTLFGAFFLLSLYQQDVLGFSPLRTGVGNLAIALTAVVASGVSQALVTRYGVKPVLLFGLTLLGGGLAYFTQIGVHGSYLTDLFPGFLLVGVGIGFAFVPVSIAALTGVTGREAGLASGLINTSQQIGGAVGLAILTTVATTRTNNLLTAGAARPTALTDGFRLAFWVGVGFALVAFVVTLVTLKRRDCARRPHGSSRTWRNPATNGSRPEPPTPAGHPTARRCARRLHVADRRVRADHL
jgi:EmrB/QacA subfamily drug resistance transporter